MRDPGVGGSHGERWDGEHRAQLVLVAGFVLAVTFVALALLLNSAIFAENLATRQTGGTGAEAEQISGSVDRALEEQVRQINDNSTVYNHRVLRRQLSETTDNWSDLTNRQLSVDGTLLRASIQDTTNGVRIRHTDATEEWVNRPGASDWTVYHDTPAEDVLWYRFTVDREGLLRATLGNTLGAVFDNVFHIRITNESGTTWNVYVFRGNLLDDNVYVMAGRDADFDLTDPFYNEVSNSCIANSEEVTVELWRGTVNGVSCDELSFVRNISGEVTVEYRNSDSFLDDQTGTYEISLNTTTGVDESDFYNSSVSTDSPHILSTFTRVEVERQIQRPDSVYTETTTVEPTQPDPVEPSDAPRPTISISEPGASLSLGVIVGTEFTVDWQVRDANEDLDSVEVSVSPDPDTSTPGPPWTHSVSGSDATGSDLYECDEGGLIGDCPDQYTITVTATDEAGHTTTVSQEFTYTDDLLNELGLL